MSFLLDFLCIYCHRHGINAKNEFCTRSAMLFLFSVLNAVFNTVAMLFFGSPLSIVMGRAGGKLKKNNVAFI